MIAVDVYDVWSRFARTELSTPLRRGVCLQVVAAAAPVAVAEISRAVGSGEDEVAEVLQAFEEAGIVEAAGDEDGETRYRWRADQRCLFTKEGESLDRVDPVCGMAITEDSPYALTVGGGRSVRFCSGVCLDTYRGSIEGLAARTRVVGGEQGAERAPAPMAESKRASFTAESAGRSEPGGGGRRGAERV